MFKKIKQPIKNVELVAYIEQLDALVIVCNESGTISIDSGGDTTIARQLAELIKGGELNKPIELVGVL